MMETTCSAKSSILRFTNVVNGVIGILILCDMVVMFCLLMLFLFQKFLRFSSGNNVTQNP